MMVKDKGGSTIIVHLSQLIIIINNVCLTCGLAVIMILADLSLPSNSILSSRNGSAFEFLLPTQDT